MNGPGEGVPLGADWSVEQVLRWMDEFRCMVLLANAEQGLTGAQVYDKIRRADPSRRPAAPLPHRTA